MSTQPSTTVPQKRSADDALSQYSNDPPSHSFNLARKSPEISAETPVELIYVNADDEIIDNATATGNFLVGEIPFPSSSVGGVSDLIDDADAEANDDFVPDSLASFIHEVNENLIASQQDFFESTPTKSDGYTTLSQDAPGWEADLPEEEPPVLLEDEQDKALRGEILDSLEARKQALLRAQKEKEELERKQLLQRQEQEKRLAEMRRQREEKERLERETMAQQQMKLQEQRGLLSDFLASPDLLNSPPVNPVAHMTESEIKREATEETSTASREDSAKKVQSNKSPKSHEFDLERDKVNLSQDSYDPVAWLDESQVNAHGMQIKSISLPEQGSSPAKETYDVNESFVTAPSEEFIENVTSTPLRPSGLRSPDSESIMTGPIPPAGLQSKLNRNEEPAASRGSNKSQQGNQQPKAKYMTPLSLDKSLLSVNELSAKAVASPDPSELSHIGDVNETSEPSPLTSPKTGRALEESPLIPVAPPPSPSTGPMAVIEPPQKLSVDSNAMPPTIPEHEKQTKILIKLAALPGKPSNEDSSKQQSSPKPTDERNKASSQRTAGGSREPPGNKRETSATSAVTYDSGKLSEQQRKPPPIKTALPIWGSQPLTPSPLSMSSPGRQTPVARPTRKSTAAIKPSPDRKFPQSTKSATSKSSAFKAKFTPATAKRLSKPRTYAAYYKSDEPRSTPIQTPKPSNSNVRFSAATAERLAKPRAVKTSSIPRKKVRPYLGSASAERLPKPTAKVLLAQERIHTAAVEPETSPPPKKSPVRFSLRTAERLAKPRTPLRTLVAKDTHPKPANNKSPVRFTPATAARLSKPRYIRTLDDSFNPAAETKETHVQLEQTANQEHIPLQKPRSESKADSDISLRREPSGIYDPNADDTNDVANMSLDTYPLSMPSVQQDPSAYITTIKGAGSSQPLVIPSSATDKTTSVKLNAKAAGRIAKVQSDAIKAAKSSYVVQKASEAQLSTSKDIEKFRHSMNAFTPKLNESSTVLHDDAEGSNPPKVHRITGGASSSSADPEGKALFSKDSVDSGQAKARERVRQRNARDQTRKQLAEKARKAKLEQKAKAKALGADGVAKARRRLRQRQLQSGTLVGKENDSRVNRKSRTTIPHSPKFATTARHGGRSAAREESLSMALSTQVFGKLLRDSGPQAPRVASRPRITIPQAPKFATDARLGSRTSRAANVSNEQKVNSCASFERGLRGDDMSVGSVASSQRSLTIPNSPKFASSRNGRKQKPNIEHVSLAQSTDFLLKGFRDCSQPAASSRKKGPTIPVAPKFQKLSQRRQEKSSEERDLEEIEKYKANPFKARPLLVSKPAIIHANKPSNKRITMPQPFHFHSKDTSTVEAASSKTKEKNADEAPKHFKARPMPSFSHIKENEQTTAVSRSAVADPPAKIESSPSKCANDDDSRVASRSKNLEPHSAPDPPSARAKPSSKKAVEKIQVKTETKRDKPSVEPAPPKSSPTKASLARASPVKVSPAEGSPAKASHAKASPAKASPTKASPAETPPTKASPAKASPSEATPPRTPGNCTVVQPFHLSTAERPEKRAAMTEASRRKAEQLAVEKEMQAKLKEERRQQAFLTEEKERLKKEDSDFRKKFAAATQAPENIRSERQITEPKPFHFATDARLEASKEKEKKKFAATGENEKDHNVENLRPFVAYSPKIKIKQEEAARRQEGHGHASLEKTTEPKPFHFATEIRHAASQEKQRKLLAKQEEGLRNQAEFHASPAPHTTYSPQIISSRSSGYVTSPSPSFD